jgi:hypothetical protein
MLVLAAAATVFVVVALPARSMWHIAHDAKVS